MDLSCRRIDFNAASRFYDNYEHLGDPGRGVYHWGAFSSNLLVAAVSIGTTGFSLTGNMYADLAETYDLNVYQLTRGGTSPAAPKNTGSWIVSRSLKGLRLLKGDSIVVAYSDPKYNEVGTIYQASNFLYLGKTDPKGQSNYVINGEWMSGWQVRKEYGTRCMDSLQKECDQVDRLPLRPKFRYMYVTSRPRIKQSVESDVEHLVEPYPKRTSEGIPEMNVESLVTQRRSMEASNTKSQG